MATSAQQDWLKSDALAQTQKNQVDLDLESQLANMLRERGAFQQQNALGLSAVNRAAPDTFESVAGGFGSRGLLSSSAYQQADDKAFQTVQQSRNDLSTKLNDYLGTYDQSVQQKRAAAEAQKRGIEAQALQRYAEQFAGKIGG